MQKGIEYYPLSQNLTWLELIAKWHHTQWGYLRPAETLQDVRTLYLGRLQRDQLPVTYVLCKEDAPVGMFSLLHNTYPFFQDTSIPVLNHLFIAQPYRGRGFFKLTMNFVNQIAAQMGFKEICGFTIDKRLNRLYEQLDCYCVGESVFLAHKIFLFRKFITSF